ncbi:FAD-dependent oxidoreductase [Brevundimonas vesicularis]|uniref:FAD-dependent oxidoreductase n=1 Tax=Brevundimonas vesicularis TaxID=41276 RepID=UPI0038D3DD9E
MLPSSVDVIVVGSGAGGLTAAITAARGGQRVLLVEKADVVGGTTAWSGGGVWIPTNHHMSAAGEPDSPEMAATYIQAMLGNHFDAEMTTAFVRNGRSAIRFLEDNSRSIRFVSYPGSDYHPDLPGAAKKARTLLPKPYDGRQLGPWLKRLRRPKSEMTIFDGMQIEATEIRDFQSMFRSPTSMIKVLGLMSRYGLDRLRYGRATRMIRGTALAAAMLEAALDAGVDIRTDVSVRTLIRRGGRIAAVEFDSPSGPIEVLARKGVVMATGGFSSNPKWREAHLPCPDQHLSLLPVENAGDGLRLGQDVGAVLGGGLGSPAIFTPGSRRRLRDGSESVYPHFAFDRCKPGALLVDASGRRFVNEAQSYHTLIKRMHELGIAPAWLIGDHRFLRRYGMGMARPAPAPYRSFVREGYLVQAPTLADLARRIGVDADALVQTAAEMNLFAETGVDETFGKGSDIYTRVLGDAEHAPNPCLGPVRQAPFYALALWPTDVGTSLGLAIGPDGAVKDGDGAAIPGLFAAGLDAHASLRGYYPGAGTQIGQAIAFGYAAGRTLSGLPLEP